MYQAIVFLPLLGAVVAALIALAGARARHPGGSPSVGAEDHAHGPVAEDRPHGAPVESILAAHSAWLSAHTLGWLRSVASERLGF